MWAEALRLLRDPRQLSMWNLVNGSPVSSKKWNAFVQLSLLRLRGTKTIVVHEGRPWGHERVTVPAALIRQFRRHGLIRERLEYYRTLPNVRAADRFLWLDKKLPAVLKPLFTHFNLVLRKLPA